MGHSLFSVTPQKVKLVNTKNRIIKTKIPLPNTDKKIKTLSNIESRSMHGQLPIIWDRAEGYKVYDSAGNCWIDFTSTIFVKVFVLLKLYYQYFHHLLKLFRN